MSRLAPSDPVDVTGLIREVRDPDLPDDERVDAARLLIVGCAIRSLDSLIVLVRGDGDLPMATADACLDGWALVQSLG